MNKLGTWLISAQTCLLGLFAVSGVVQADCGPAPCANYIHHDERCRPGDCYLYEELVSCTADNYSCKDGTRRIWSYRPLYYVRDNTELLINLDKKLCPNARECKWPFTRSGRY